MAIAPPIKRVLREKTKDDPSLPPPVRRVIQNSQPKTVADPQGHNIRGNKEKK
jgi:hypothetical protein